MSRTLEVEADQRVRDALAEYKAAHRDGCLLMVEVGIAAGGDNDAITRAARPDGDVVASIRYRAEQLELEARIAQAQTRSMAAAAQLVYALDAAGFASTAPVPPADVTLTTEDGAIRINSIPWDSVRAPDGGVTMWSGDPPTSFAEAIEQQAHIVSAHDQAITPNGSKRGQTISDILRQVSIAAKRVPVDAVKATDPRVDQLIALRTDDRKSVTDLARELAELKAGAPSYPPRVPGLVDLEHKLGELRDDFEKELVQARRQGMFALGRPKMHKTTSTVFNVNKNYITHSDFNDWRLVNTELVEQGTNRNDTDWQHVRMFWERDVRDGDAVPGATE